MMKLDHIFQTVLLKPSSSLSVQCQSISIKLFNNIIVESYLLKTRPQQTREQNLDQSANLERQPYL